MTQQGSFEQFPSRCSSAGVFPIFRGSFETTDLQKLMTIANNSMENNGAFSEQTLLLTPDIHMPLTEWFNLWTDEDRTIFENVIKENTDEEHEELAAQPIAPNMMLRQILDECAKHPNLGDFKTGVGVEAFSSKVYQYTRGLYDRSNYSVFAGSRDLGERPMDTAVRELREEGKLVLSPAIWNIKNQQFLRHKYGLSKLPTSMNITLRPRKYMKIFLMVMDNVTLSESRDENGPFVYVDVQKKKK